MRLISRGAVVCIGAFVVAGSSPASAKPVVKEHYSFQQSDTFTDTECGDPITIDYTAEFSGVFKLSPRRQGDPTPYLFDNYSGVETFTNVANDKTATVFHQGLYKDVHVEHVEGTVYRFTAIETGRPAGAIGPEGEKLLFDAGRIRYTFLVDTMGDTDLSNDVFLGDVGEPDVAGPHPVFFGEGTFCGLLDVLR
jgi:hypothetical protein